MVSVLGMTLAPAGEVFDPMESQSQFSEVEHAQSPG
jgi:hypothetical protein